MMASAFYENRQKKKNNVLQILEINSNICSTFNNSRTFVIRGYATPSCHASVQSVRCRPYKRKYSFFYELLKSLNIL